MLKGYKITFYAQGTPLWVKESPEMPTREELDGVVIYLAEQGAGMVDEISIKGL